MEKLLIKSNGQWELAKAWGNPDYDNVDHGRSPFKDSASGDEAKTKFVKRIKDMDQAEYKNMPNMHTGKDELHVLLHRGVSSEDPKYPINPKASGQNKIDFSNGKTIKTTNNSIHTHSEKEAHGHAKDGDIGKALSFWVPISNIHGHNRDINIHHDPTNKTKYDETNYDHVMIAPGEYNIHNTTDYGS